MKSKVYRTVVRPAALYEAETFAATAAVEKKLHGMEMRMLRWSLGYTLLLLDRQRVNDVRRWMGTAPIGEKLRESRLRWFGHVLRRELDSVARRGHEMKGDGKIARARLKL